MSEEPEHRLAPGLGVIEWQGQILVYQMEGERLVWTRVLGAQRVEPSPELIAAITADRRRGEGGV